MRYVLIISLMFLFACGEDEDTCQSCTVIVESNQREAELKCLGLANNYPRFSEDDRFPAGELCRQSDKDDAVERLGRSTTRVYCSGVTGTVRSRIECR